MKYVLDSSVALKTALAEIDSPQAIRLLDDFHNGIHELLAPDVFHVEVGHALTRAERQGGFCCWFLFQNFHFFFRFWSRFRMVPFVFVGC